MDGTVANLNEDCSLDLSVNLNASRSAKEFQRECVDHGKVETMVAGASNSSNLAESLKELGMEVTDLT